MLLFSDPSMLMRYVSPSGYMGLRCLMLTLSGHAELWFLLCFIVTWICVVVSIILVVYSLCVFLYMCLFVMCVLCLTVLVNCLLDAFAICVGEVNVFYLKVIVLILGCTVFLLVNPCMVLQEYICCVYDPSVCLLFSSICQICVFVSGM